MKLTFSTGHDGFVADARRSTCAAGTLRRMRPTRQLAFDVFKQLIEINTTESVGNVTTAANAMAQRLLDAGFSQKDIVDRRSGRSQEKPRRALPRQRQGQTDSDHLPSRCRRSASRGLDHRSLQIRRERRLRLRPRHARREKRRRDPDRHAHSFQERRLRA